MDTDQAERLQTSPLMQRLAHRHTQPGVINLSRYSSGSTGLPGWIVQRSALVEQLQTRYSSRDTDSAGGTELALATVSPAIDRVARSPQATPAGAIVPSTPLVTTASVIAPSPVTELEGAIVPSTPLTEAPVSSEPLLLSATASVIAPSPITESDVATFVTAPETIAPFNESVGEVTIAPVQPTQQYRIRRVAANSTTPSATIQRKAAPDESSAAIVPVSPMQLFHETVSTTPEAPPRARVDDSPSMADSAVPVLELAASPTSIAPISTLQSGEPTAQTTLVWRHALSDTPPVAAIVSEAIAQPSLVPAQPASVAVPVVRPLMQPASLPAIVQRSTDTHPQSMTEFSTQKPAAFGGAVSSGIASARSMNALPLQPSLVWRSGADAVTHDVLQRHLQQQHIQPELPLAMSAGSVVQPAIARQTEMTGTAAIASVSPPSNLPTPSPAPVPMPSSGVNVGQIAEQVSRILFRQLTVERERRGMGKWS